MTSHWKDLKLPPPRKKHLLYQGQGGWAVLGMIQKGKFITVLHRGGFPELAERYLSVLPLLRGDLYFDCPPGGVPLDVVSALRNIWANPTASLLRLASTGGVPPPPWNLQPALTKPFHNYFGGDMAMNYKDLILKAYDWAGGKNTLGMEKFVLPWRERFPHSLGWVLPHYNPRLLDLFGSDVAPHLTAHSRFAVELQLPFQIEPGLRSERVPWIKIMGARTPLYRAALLSLLHSWPPQEMLELEAALQPDPQE